MKCMDMSVLKQDLFLLESLKTEILIKKYSLPLMSLNYTKFLKIQKTPI